MKKLIIGLCLLLGLMGCGTEKESGAIVPIFHDFVTKSEASLFMVGDALLHGAVYKQAQTSDGSYDFSEMTSVLGEIAPKYDLRFYNQETILGGTEIGLSTYPRFNSPQEFGDAMMSYGFNLVSLANNHTMDRNQEGIDLSLDYWANQNVMTAGSYASWDDRDQLDIRSVNGISYTLLAYTYGTNGIPIPEGKEYLCNVYTKEMLIEDINRVREQVDVLMVSMHWGVEYTHTPTAEQKEIAKLLADLGVDIVIGHHPHVIQPVEWIDNTIVYYSLGNLISAQDGIMRTIGLMGALTIEKVETPLGVNILIKEPKADLIFTNYDNGYRNLKIKTFDQLDASYQSIYDEYTKVITRLDDSIIVGGIK